MLMLMLSPVRSAPASALLGPLVNDILLILSFFSVFFSILTINFLLSSCLIFIAISFFFIPMLET